MPERKHEISREAFPFTLLTYMPDGLQDPNGLFNEKSFKDIWRQRVAAWIDASFREELGSNVNQSGESRNAHFFFGERSAWSFACTFMIRSIAGRAFKSIFGCWWMANVMIFLFLWSCVDIILLLMISAIWWVAAVSLLWRCHHWSTSGDPPQSLTIGHSTSPKPPWRWPPASNVGEC